MYDVSFKLQANSCQLNNYLSDLYISGFFLSLFIYLTFELFNHYRILKSFGFQDSAIDFCNHNAFSGTHYSGLHSLWKLPKHCIIKNNFQQ